MNKKLSSSKKDDTEEPLIDQSNEGLKKLILKGKKKGFLHRSQCEKALENEKFEDKEEFYSRHLIKIFAKHKWHDNTFSWRLQNVPANDMLLW